MKDIFLLIKNTFNKYAIYIMFGVLWINFMLYHRNFFTPYNFWLFFSIFALFLIPCFLFISIEENRKNIKYFSLAFFILSTLIIILSMLNRNIKLFFIKDNIYIIFILSGLIVFTLINIFAKKIYISELGVNFKNMKLTFFIILIGVIIMIPIIIIASRNPEFHKVYPLFKIMKSDIKTFILYEFYFLIFFFCWEFFFRGFLLFSLIKNIKEPILAILIQTIIFTFAHLGKPEIETISSFFGGILLGIIVYKTKNIWAAVILHFIIALTMDIIAVFF